LSGNFLIAATIESLGEAVALIRKAGIDPHRYVEILTGTLFSAPVYETYGAIIADERYEPAGFNMTLGLKDVSLALVAAHKLRVPLPAASLIRDHSAKAAAIGRRSQKSAQKTPGSDCASVARLCPHARYKTIVTISVHRNRQGRATRCSKACFETLRIGKDRPWSSGRSFGRRRKRFRRCRRL
jgi:hypothetical protein